jgi:Uma2 family endonuclease
METTLENVVQEPAVAYDKLITPEDYLQMLWQDGIRYEYWEGELFAMAGTTITHNVITGNIYALLRAFLNGKKCKVLFTDVNVSLKQETIFVLPDIIVTCNEDDLNANRIIRNPSILMEVLSDSTELHDRKRKWEQYRRIKSLRYYLLVSQDRYYVEMFHRPNEQTLFSFQSFEGLDALIPFEDFSFSIPMKDVYEGITITEITEE